MTEIETGTGEDTFCLPLPFFGRENSLQVSPIVIYGRKRPSGVPLLNISCRQIIQIRKHPLLEIQEILPGRAAFRQDGAEIIEILIAASPPGSVGQGQGRYIQVVLKDDGLFIRNIAVVPKGDNGAGQVRRALVGIIDAAGMKAYNISEEVKMVDVMQPAVHRGNPPLRLAPVAPELGGVNLAGRIVPARIPGNGLSSFRTHEGHHFRHEFRHGEAHLVRTNVDVLRGEHSHQLFQQLFHHGQALGSLHPETEGPLEGGAVAWHIQLRHQRNTPLPAIGVQGTELFLGIVQARLAGHGLRRIQLRIPEALHAPGLIFRQMQVKNIEFEARESIHLPVKLFQGNIGASHIHHPPAYAERRPVGDGAARDMAVLRELGKRLPGIPEAFFRHGIYPDAVPSYAEPISLVCIQPQSRDAVHPNQLRMGRLNPASLHPHLLGKGKKGCFLQRSGAGNQEQRKAEYKRFHILQVTNNFLVYQLYAVPSKGLRCMATFGLSPYRFHQAL